MKILQTSAKTYNEHVADIRNENIADADGMVMQKEELNDIQKSTSRISGTLVAVGVVICLVIIFIVLKRRKEND